MRTGAVLDGLARTRLGAAEVGDGLTRSAGRVGDALVAAGAAAGSSTTRAACAHADEVLVPLLRRLARSAADLSAAAGYQQESYAHVDRP